MKEKKIHVFVQNHLLLLLYQRRKKVNSRFEFQVGIKTKVQCVPYVHHFHLCVTHLRDFLPVVSGRIRLKSTELFFKRVLFEDIQLEEKNI